MNKVYDFSELQQIIEINSHTKNKAGVDSVHKVYTQWMTDLGFIAIEHEREHIGNHLHYRSPKVAGVKVLLLGHQDTVFPKGTFEAYKEDDDWIYGPGVCDMKGGNYIALKALRNIHQRFGGIKNIDVLMVSDEETGSDDSKTLTTAIAKQYDICMVFEAAGKNHDVVIARKGIATWKINIQGKAAHAGNHYSDGINANQVAAKLLINLTELTCLERGTTVNVGKIKGGIGANTISPGAELMVEARFSESHEKNRVMQAFEQLCTQNYLDGAQISYSGGLQRDVMQPSESQQELVKQIEEILDEKLILEKRGGVSDANVASAAGTATLDGWGPFGDGDHTIYERALKRSFVKREEQVTQILTAFCGR